jgi:methylated-DNA-[protein]-cysteine S-methyltransferase
VAADLRLGGVTAPDVLEFRHTSIRTPLGELTIVASERGILAADLAEDRDGFLAWAEERYEARAVRDGAGLAGVRDEVRAYFDGSLRRFRTPVDLSRVRTEFFRSVYEAAIAVPYGELRTYGDLAGEAGRPRAARAAGHAMHVCPIELWIPCHRIVPAGPGFGTYGAHPERREFLLRLEGAL